MGVFGNIKNAKKNWQSVQSSPYASLYFRYQTTKITIILFCAFIAWQIYSIIVNYRGSGYVAWISRGFTLLIGVLIISKAWQTLTPMKRAMKPYEKNKEHINHKNLDVKVEVDDILSKFDDDGKIKEPKENNPYVPPNDNNYKEDTKI